MKEAKESGESFPKQMHAYAYGKWTKDYVKWLRNHTMPNASDKKKEKWANNYHGKVIPLELAESIITLDQDIPLTDLEQIIPYTTARNLIMSSPTDVVLYECACRGAAGNHCSPSRVCMVIGKPFTDVILEQHPDMANRATKEEALAVLRDEENRGHMHTAWFKDVFMGRFYAICNCCTCCCVGLRAMKVNGVRMLAPSGYVAELDEKKCNDCGKCADVCPFGAISFTDKKLGFDFDKCMGCGVCVGQCEQEARALVRDERKGIPMDVVDIVRSKSGARTAAAPAPTAQGNA
jgi:ferredoxin